MSFCNVDSKQKLFYDLNLQLLEKITDQTQTFFRSSMLFTVFRAVHKLQHQRSTGYNARSTRQERATNKTFYY